MIESSISETKGKAIIFIHGSGENSYIWKHQLEDLNSDYNLIAVDLPSHGKSDSVSELSLELYINVIKALANTLNLQKLILCGHSLGGAIAISYYFEYPLETYGLILCSTGARLKVNPFILNITKNSFNEYLEYIPLGNFYVNTPEKIKEDYIKQTAMMDSEVVHTDYKICDNFNVMDKIASIKIPCLLICGNKDRLTPVKYSKYFQEKIEKSKLVLIPKSGHGVMLEKPDEFNQAINDFIENDLKS